MILSMIGGLCKIYPVLCIQIAWFEDYSVSNVMKACEGQRVLHNWRNVL